MADVFLSYSSEDREVARRLAQALGGCGFSVWWDRKIPVGRTFDEVIEAQIAAANCLVVLWSEHSIKSDWVRAEADEGRRRKILASVRIADVRIPLAFRMNQAADLIDWHGESDHDGYQGLRARVSELLEAADQNSRGRGLGPPEKPGVPAAKPAPTPSWATRWRPVLMAGVILAAVVASGLAVFRTLTNKNVIVSDSFARANGDSCNLGQADLKFGGSGHHYYMPVFLNGAAMVSGALQNVGTDFGGVQFTASPDPCHTNGFIGENLGQNLRIRSDLLVPTDAKGNITRAGPYFRTRSAAARDGLMGGSSAGYWVQLLSNGDVQVKQLNPFATVARSGRFSTFDSGTVHTLEIAVNGNELQVVLDNRLQRFFQNNNIVDTVSVPSTWDVAHTGSDQGAAGVAFGDEDNRGQIGGQRASHLVIEQYKPFGNMPVRPIGSL